MNDLCKSNWEETKVAITDFRKNENTGLALLHLNARKPEIERLTGGNTYEGENADVFCRG